MSRSTSQLEQVATDITALLDANGGRFVCVCACACMCLFVWLFVLYDDNVFSRTMCSDEVVQQLFEAFVAHVFGGQSTTVGSPLGALVRSWLVVNFYFEKKTILKYQFSMY